MKRVVLAIALIAPLSFAQERKRYDSVLATVNGAAITESEVDEFAQVLGPNAGPTDAIVRELVLTRLEADAAAAAGVKVPDDVLNDEMDRRAAALGGTEAYRKALIGFGRSAEQDREFVRKRLAARAWVDATVGLVPNSPLLRPELARSVRVSPEEVRAFFETNRATLQTARVRTVAYVVLHKGDFDRDAEALASARALRERVTPTCDLAATAAKAGIARCGTWTFRGDDTLGLRAEVVRAAWTLPVGEVAAPVDQGKTLLLLHVLSEEGGTTVAFEDVQDAIQRHLIGQKRASARAALDRDLLERATVHPADLFGATPAPPAPASKGVPEREAASAASDGG
ncbi:MAG: peptidyl-prolyl cis-trans isomerase [Planctomycetes bacterium]|nr:peptidyl-prolyl cis-trans isomerase [Planctomycetota bacterium]MCC7170436.1 peptidyl-prolyl cis-trans isomerase [Planctomycetota bacterium]